MADTNNNAQTKTTDEKPQFAIQRIYTKEVSLEAPKTPALFQKEWKPELDLQIQTASNNLGEEVHEVVLKLTATVKTAEETAFLIEIQQAGIFTLHGFPTEQVGPILGGVCPGILFPYAREVISDLVTRATFPPLYLAPINFDALYQQHVEQKAKGAKTEPEASTPH